MSRIRSCLAAVAVAAMFISGAAHAAYKLTVIAAPGSPETFAVGISSAGVIAGTYYVPKSGRTISYTYDTRLQHPTLQTFDVPAQHGGTVTDTVIAAISLHGDIGGNYTETAGGHSKTYGFIYSAKSGMFTTVDYPGGVQTTVTAISSMGTVGAGVYYTPGFPHPFVYTGGIYRAINTSGMDNNSGLQPQTVNNSGFVTGSYFNITRNQNRSFTAARLTAVDYNPKPAMAGCGINGANPPGTVFVGYCYNPTQGLVAQGMSANLYTAPTATQTVLGAINVKNTAAGSAVTPSGNVVFSTDGTTANYVIVPANWDNVTATGINAANKIVGRFTDSNDSVIKVFWAH